MKTTSGLTLLEILVALFIFTIVAMLLVGTLHHVLTLQSQVEKNADRLRKLQNLFLVISRDVQGIVNRPVLSITGKEELAFEGAAESLTFTHLGIAHPDKALGQSKLQRVQYVQTDQALWRNVFEVVDKTEHTKQRHHQLFTEIKQMQFEYLDQTKLFHSRWPDGEKDALPRAIKVTVTLNGSENVSQLYVVSAENKK